MGTELTPAGLTRASLAEFPNAARIRDLAEGAADAGRTLEKQRNDRPPKDAFEQRFVFGRLKADGGTWSADSKDLYYSLQGRNQPVKRDLVQVIENRHGHEATVWKPKPDWRNDEERLVNEMVSVQPYVYSLRSGRTKGDSNFDARGFWLKGRLIPLPWIDEQTQTVHWYPRLKATAVETTWGKARERLDLQVVAERAQLDAVGELLSQAEKNLELREAAVSKLTKGVDSSEKEVASLRGAAHKEGERGLTTLRGSLRKAERELVKSASTKRELEVRKDTHEERVARAELYLERHDRTHKGRRVFDAYCIVSDVCAVTEPGIRKELDSVRRLLLPLQHEVDRGKAWLRALGPWSSGKKRKTLAELNEQLETPRESDLPLIAYLTEHRDALQATIAESDAVNEGERSYSALHAVLKTALRNLKATESALQARLDNGEFERVAQSVQARGDEMLQVSDQGALPHVDNDWRALEGNSLFMDYWNELNPKQSEQLPAAEPVEAAPAVEMPAPAPRRKQHKDHRQKERYGLR